MSHLKNKYHEVEELRHRQHYYNNLFQKQILQFKKNLSFRIAGKIRNCIPENKVRYFIFILFIKIKAKTAQL